jgi:Ecp2-like pathogen effector protein (putative necrosis-inducing factor)
MSAIKLSLGLVAVLAIFGQAAPAAPTLAASTQELPSTEDFMAGVDTSEWVSVEFQGKTVTYDPAALDFSGQGTSKRADDSGAHLFRRAVCGNDCCGGSSFNPQAGPFARVSDCLVIRDWAYAQNRPFSIWTNTPDYHGVVFAGSCAFGAGTRNVQETFVGSSDIGDLTRDGINIWQVSVFCPRLWDWLSPQHLANAKRRAAATSGLPATWDAAIAAGVVEVLPCRVCSGSSSATAADGLGRISSSASDTYAGVDGRKGRLPYLSWAPTRHPVSVQCWQWLDPSRPGRWTHVFNKLFLS